MRFCSLLARHLGARNLSGNAFARLSGSNQSHLSKILRSQRPPPLERVAAWADLLQLSHQDRLVLVALAELEHVPAGLLPSLRLLAQHVGPHHIGTGDAAERLASVTAALLAFDAGSVPQVSSPGEQVAS
jgi:transcriptional regulator with XRE-family HTH domain